MESMRKDYREMSSQPNNLCPKIAVLIPCYNESQTIAKVISDFQAELPDADIYVYDNNSTDGTDDIARTSGAIVRYERRQGKGNVIRSMFRDIEADCYIMVDGDDTYPPTNAREMVNKVLNEGYDMVVGDRLSSTYFTENKRFGHNFGNVLVRKMVNLLFKGKITDIMTGYRAFSRLFVKSFPVLSHGFEIETEMTVHTLDKNLSYTCIPTDYQDRPQGSVSKLNTLSDGLKVIKTIFVLFKDYKPLAFFSLIAALLMITAISLFVPLLVAFYQTGVVEKMPTLVGCSFLGISSLLMFAVGLILDTETQKSRQQFELHLNILSMLKER